MVQPNTMYVYVGDTGRTYDASWVVDQVEEGAVYREEEERLHLHRDLRGDEYRTT